MGCCFAKKKNKQNKPQRVIMFSDFHEKVLWIFCCNEQPVLFR